jgi:ferric-dicitrate binding protein FerR (iron transport regulator)
MRATFRVTVLVSALGMLSGWMAAQEQGAAAAQEPAVKATQVENGVSNGVDNSVSKGADNGADNGALPGDSHVRIVRLSDVKGALGLDRMTGHGFEQTMQNMPIVEGAKLRTADGYAEVEFEDNSTLRLAPETQVDFSLLALRSSGAKASTMNVVKGTVYVSTESTKDNEFLLEAGGAKMMVAPSTHLRLEFDGGKAVVSVFKGNVEVQRGEDTTVVDKKESLTLAAGEMTVAKKIAEEPFDGWDKESIDYHERYSKANAFAGSGNAFGLSDLNYYGNFINAGGCGQMWQPYMVSAAWSPYANGVWALYPGAGYSWVSPYPWGWLPYHSGSWAFCNGVGWGWQPGGSWYGLNNIAGVGGFGANGLAKNPVRSPLRPTVPQVAAGAAKPSLVLSNQRPMVFSKEDRPGNFVFQKDSAGLGVPRGSLGNLNKISNNVERHGSANMSVYATAPTSGMEGNNHAASRGPVTLRAGSPGEGSMGERGNSGVSSASRQGAYEGQSAHQGSQASPSYHGASQPMSSPASNSSGGARGGGASPK